MTQPSVLIVDDEPHVRDVLEFFLREAGYGATSTGDPEEALARARRGGIDLILLDVLMPRMDGFDLCQMLQAHPSTAAIPVVFLTALGDEVSRERARVSGASRYLQKPFSRRDVLEAVRAALASRPPAPPRAGSGWSRSVRLTGRSRRTDADSC